MSKPTKRQNLQSLVTQTYVKLVDVAWSEEKTRTAVLARLGNYEVRLIERLLVDGGLMPNLWMELYAKDLRLCIDSCSCDDLESAVLAAELFLAHARQLNEEPASYEVWRSFERDVSDDGPL